MWLLREKLSDFGVKQTLYRVDIALYVQTKNSLWSHLWAIMVLDHSRWGVENKFLENKSGRIFCVRQVYKFVPINLGGCKPFFYLFLYLFFLYTTSEEKEYYEALFLSYRPRTKCSITQFFKTNCIHSILRIIEARVDF